MLVDVWRSGSSKLPDAIRSYKTHVANRKAKPDWKGFVIGIFGLDAIMPLLNKRPAALVKQSICTSGSSLLRASSCLFLMLVYGVQLKVPMHAEESFYY